MAVHWQDSTSPARIKALAAAEASGEFDPKVPTWDIYCDLREALIWALLSVGFPKDSPWEITEKNWQKIYVRLNILEKANGCRRIYNNGTHKSREVFFTPQEIESMVGLSVNAGNKSDAEFKKNMMDSLLDDAQAKLEGWTEPNERFKKDPYYWEKLHAPKS